MKPTIGRIVHFTTLGTPAEVVPAIINGINDDGTVALVVFFRGGTFGALERIEHTDADAGSGPAAGRWAWPKVMG